MKFPGEQIGDDAGVAVDLFRQPLLRALCLGGDLTLPCAGSLTFGTRLRDTPKPKKPSDAHILNGVAGRKCGLLAGVGAWHGLNTREALNVISGWCNDTQVKLYPS
ncbi:MAG: hypothetical protein EON54_09225 [Alcaligenaceae bacterium]|nr:MAG: hypothetical protein EON54_09225 [Alcaligenaceae bacterium]